MTLGPEQYTALIREKFLHQGRPDTAFGQMAYLKNQFAFFGLKMPQWMALTKEHFKEFGIPSWPDLQRVVQICYADHYREMHYFALELTHKNLKKLPGEIGVQLLETLTTTHSWWDTVDWIAKLAGEHFLRYPMLIEPTIERWMASGNIWLQRICLIFQLKYREKTDAELLFHCIREIASSKEFFLQKGAGWALRQYARTNPDAVRHFVNNTILSPLSRREALRLID